MYNNMFDIRSEEEKMHDLKQEMFINNKIFNRINICDNIAIKNDQKDYPMSLIALVKNDNGIVVASDSKTSINERGIVKEDLIRGNIQKVFKTDDFIFAICGINEVFINNSTQNIEDVINEILQQKNYNKPNILGNEFTSIPFLNFTKYFYKLLKESRNLLNDKNPISILGGYKINNNYEVVEYHLGENFNIFPQIGREKFLRLGYISITPSEFSMPAGLSIQEMQDLLKQYIELVIKMGDLVLPYNPVGGKIQIESFT